MQRHISGQHLGIGFDGVLVRVARFGQLLLLLLDHAQRVPADRKLGSRLTAACICVAASGRLLVSSAFIAAFQAAPAATECLNRS